MLPVHRPGSKLHGSRLSLLALMGMALIITGLLIVNYYSHRTLLDVNKISIQQNLEDRCRSVSYFFSERENDLRSLAESAVITGYFTNRAMGMTMTYGLRASLNSIARLLEQQGASSQLGGKLIYSQLLLLDENGSELSRWTEKNMAPKRAVAEKVVLHASKIQMESYDDGLIAFTCPVYQNDKVIGFVQGWMHYATLVEYLLKDVPGVIVITDLQRIVFQTPSTQHLTELFQPIFINDRSSSIAVSTDLLNGAMKQGVDKFRFNIFSATVAGYNAAIYLFENQTVDELYRNQLFSMAVLIALTLGAFGATVLITRAGAKRFVLETALVEAHKREKAIAEKKEELELVLEGARLGTWNWDVVNGQFEFNERFCAMLGYEQDELKLNASTWKMLLHPDDRSCVFSAVKGHFHTETPYYFSEHRLRHKSGGWIWVHDVGKVLQRDATGKPLRAFGILLDITERKESIKHLARAKEESDLIIRNFLDTLIVVNTSLVVIRINQATCDLLGFAEEELVGQRVSTLFHDAEDYVQSVFAYYVAHTQEQLKDGQGLRNVELCYRHKNGGRLPMSFNISLLHDDEGVVTGVVAGAKDVSHLRLALDKIATQKEYIETLFDIAPQGLLAVSPAGDIVKYNQSFRQMLDFWSGPMGMEPEECSRTLIAKVFANTSKHRHFTIVCKHADHAAYFRCSSTSIAILEGIATVISIDDITRDRKAQEEIKLLATVIEQTTDSVTITGTDDIIQYVNPATLKNTGFSLNELVGSPPQIYCNGLLEASVVNELRQAVSNGQIWRGHFKTRRKDESIMEEDVIISPVRDEEGELTHYVAIKRDITEINNLQRHLLRAQKLEAIGQLAAGIAHEINTPMQYVQNNVSFFEQVFNDLRNLIVGIGKMESSLLTAETAALLKKANLDFLMNEIPESIKDTHDGINRVVKIISAMKAFSHPGNSDKVATDLNIALESTITVCRNEWKYVADMITDFEPDLPLAQCFPDQINQVVLNLIINASHAVQSKKQLDVHGDTGRIAIATRRAGAWVEIQISDNGCGIPEEIQQRVFDPFFTTKEVGNGTGQGLAIAHDIIVNKHGGQIDLSSIPGQGTTFFIRLPL